MPYCINNRGWLLIVLTILIVLTTGDGFWLTMLTMLNGQQLLHTLHWIAVLVHA